MTITVRGKTFRVSLRWGRKKKLRKLERERQRMGGGHPHFCLDIP